MKKFLVICAIFAVIFFAACDDGGKDSVEISNEKNDQDSTENDDNGDSVSDDCTGEDCGNNDTPDTGNEEEENDADTASEEDDADSGETGDDSGDSEPDDGGPEDSGKTCKVTAGNDAKLIRGNILAGDKIFEDGEVLIGADGFIVCAGEDCSSEDAADGATIIDCPGATVSPALINGHDHLTCDNHVPGNWEDERFDHRSDWRKAKNGHSKQNVSCDAKNEQIQWVELRQLMSGTLSVAGSGGSKGFLRNVDKADKLEGVDGMDVQYSTFPLGKKDQSDGFLFEEGCDEYSIDSESVLEADCYLPHVSEGINKAARNEMLCMTGRQEGGRDLAKENSAFVHSIGIIAEDGKELADSKTAVIWSARTNISLYGNTAPVTMLKNQGVLIGLGTDWIASGSMNILRELACVDYLNKNHFNNTFSDKEIWKMATINNAAALRILDVTGAIRPGLVGDIVVFDAKDAENPYRAVIEGHEKNVALVLRGGKVLYGDENVVSALDLQNGCEKFSVCGVGKKVCVKNEIGMSLADFQSKNSNQYKLLYCGTPDDEPTCVPQRTRSEDESRPYSGPKEGDKDGDGIADNKDNCPDIFNPIRPVDNGKQADSDGDGLGDACDPCPLDKNKTDCVVPNAADKDGDGISDGEDNCPFKSNAGQEDSDKNGIGDVCEPVVEEVTIYEIKQKNTKEGTLIKVKGIVTAYNSSKKSFFIQVDTADQDSALKEKFSGLYIYQSPTTVKVGDKVSVTGKIQYYKDSGKSEIIEISNIKKVEIASSNNALPDFVKVDPAKVKTGGELKDAYNGVLVKVENVNVTEAADSYNVFGITDGLKVDDDFYSYTNPAVGTHFSLLRGVLGDTFGYSKILPRSADDFVTYDCTVSGCENEWEECNATLGCVVKADRCNSKAECPGADKVCDTTTHKCVTGDPCEGVTCEEYEECKPETGTCALLSGKCASNSDCAATEECNTTTHECFAPIIKNGGFENWTNNLPDNWVNDPKPAEITLSNVIHVIKETSESDVHGGSSALKLMATNKNKRLATKAMAIEKGTYLCEFYAKGDGAKTAVRPYFKGDYRENSIDWKTTTDSWQKFTHTININDENITDFQLLLYVVRDDDTKTYVIIDDLSCSKN